MFLRSTVAVGLSTLPSTLLQYSATSCSTVLKMHLSRDMVWKRGQGRQLAAAAAGVTRAVV